MQIEKLPECGDIGQLEVVDGKLQLLLKTHVGVLDAFGPLDVVQGVDALQKCRKTFEAIRQLGRNQVEIDSAALLEISELGDLEAVQHHLPADTPGSQRRSFPVVLFKLDVVFAKVDANRFETPQILVDDIGGRRFQNHLKLLVLVEPVGIFSVAAVGGAAARLYISHSIRLRAENAQECLGRHGSGADLDIVRLGDDAAAVGPVLLQ